MTDGDDRIERALAWLDELRRNALTVSDGYGQPLADRCVETAETISTAAHARTTLQTELATVRRVLNTDLTTASERVLTLELELTAAAHARHLAETHALDLAGRIAFLCARDIPNTEQQAKASLLTRLAALEQQINRMREHGGEMASNACAEITQLRIRLEAAEQARTTLQAENDKLHVRAVVAEQRQVLDRLGKSSYQEVVEQDLRVKLAEAQVAQETAEGDRRALQIALQTYGQHKPSCGCIEWAGTQMGVVNEAKPCTCGFQDALNEKEN